MFSSKQEGKRKDIERAFGMLQARFHILTRPCKLWSRDAMYSVMKTCVILHNIILDYEKENSQDSKYIEDKLYTPNHPFTVSAGRSVLPFNAEESAMELSRIQDAEMHRNLRDDLIEHLWNNHGNAEE